jgi:Calx-beta domain-containing protein/hydrazine synthase alpha subunit-like protein
MRRLLAIAAVFVCGRAALLALPPTAKPILFVTQIPIPEEVNSRTVAISFMSSVSPFGNHLADTLHAGRGGGLWLRFPDGSLVNLTQNATWDAPFVKPAYDQIAVRNPQVHWNGTKAIFSMVVGAPANPSDTTIFHWQLFEITALDQVTDASKGVLAHIALLPNQPSNYNNVSPCYDPNGRIIFASDRPYNGLGHLQQREEYLELPTVSGLWSLNSQTGDLFLLHHSPSGSFGPFVDTAGRVIFTNWDHLARDPEAVTDSRPGDPNYGENWAQTFNGTGNFPDELVSSNMSLPAIDIFPEPRNFDKRTLALEFNNKLNGNAFNIFLPWMINLDGTGGEILNHVGRHEIAFSLTKSFTDNSDLVDLNANVNPGYGGLTVHKYINNFMALHEDPLHPGKFFGVDCADLGTHTAGQIVSTNAAAGTNPDTMTITYVTGGSNSPVGGAATKPPFIPTVRGSINLPPTGLSPLSTPENLYRRPIPLSDGALVASVTTANQTDFDQNSDVTPQSLYNFRLMTLKLQSGGSTYYIPDLNLTNGINASHLKYWVGANQVDYTGAMWELDPVELTTRAVPPGTSGSVDPIEQSVFTEESVDVPTFQSYLQTNNAALVVSRNVTARDRHDRQQPFNLKVAWPTSSTQTIGSNGLIYPVAWVQFLEADLRRGLTLGGFSPVTGRRVVATPMHSTGSLNIPALNGQPPGSFKLGDDGSFAAIIPARKALTWHLLNNDANTTSQVKERFWVTFQPGEVRTCTNCHGINTADQAGNSKPLNQPQALRTLLRYWRTGAPAFSAANFYALKTDSAVPVSVNRMGGSNGAISVNFAMADGSALAGSDYVPTNGSLNWNNGDAAPKIIFVQLINNPTIGAPKTFTITLTSAVPAPVTPATATVQIDQPPFETWLFNQFGANANDPTIAGANVNPDHDGFTNLAEYAFNLDPNSADATQPYSITTAVDSVDHQTHLVLQYTRRLPPRDITYHVETANDLLSWLEDPSVANEFSASADPNGVTETVVVRSVQPLHQIAGGKLFLHVRITHP